MKTCFHVLCDTKNHKLTSIFSLGYFYSNPMFPLFLKLSEKRVLDPNGPCINTLQTILRNVCLSVILKFYPLSVVYGASAAYTSLCRGLKFLLNVRCIVLNYPNVTRSSIFETLCLSRTKTLTYV